MGHITINKVSYFTGILKKNWKAELVEMKFIVYASK